jgi:ribonucleotide reductase beta subunit family protein with ferritin-like domain
VAGRGCSEIALEDGAQPLRAIYQHWERHQWSPYELDFATDAASFAALDEKRRQALVWILAQRFHAEFNVAGLLGPFLTAAPDYETALVLATQIADEFRHVQAVVRAYEQVLGVEGGMEAIRAHADSHMDPVASTLYAALDDAVRPLATSPDADTFLRAVFAYHVIGEGVVGQTTQRILPSRLSGFGDFPGLVEAQRLAIREEARHIGFGVTYVRRCVTEDRDHAWSVFGHIVEGFQAMCTRMLQTEAPALHDKFLTTYGLEPEQIFEQTMRNLRLRMHSVGLHDLVTA